MAKTYKAPFTQSKNVGTAILTAANTNYSVPTATVLLFTAGTEGSIVERITAMPRATVTASMLQLYRSTDNGTTMKLVDSVLMSAFTVAATTAIPVTDFGIDPVNPLALMPNERLYAATAVALAGGIVVVAEGENF